MIRYDFQYFESVRDRCEIGARSVRKRSECEFGANMVRNKCCSRATAGQMQVQRALVYSAVLGVLGKDRRASVYSAVLGVLGHARVMLNHGPRSAHS